MLAVVDSCWQQDAAIILETAGKKDREIEALIEWLAV